LDQEKTDVCKQEINVMETYTSFHHSNKQIILSLLTTLFCIMYIYQPKLAVLNHKKCMFSVNYLLLYVSMIYWCKLPEDGDSAETGRSLHL
jgi:hypothetical protein